MARRRTLHPPALLVTLASAVLMACGVALLTVSEQAEATFPGKVGRIAYSGYDGNDYEIYTINSRGGDKVQLTNNNRDDYSPSYSPGGKRIAYVEFDRNDAEIYTINVGGSGKTKVTTGGQPSYSPDGNKIVYWDYLKTAANPHPDTEIDTINLVGGDKTQLTHNNKDEFTPDYSPDGKRIVYAGLAGLERNNAESDIYKINAAG